MSNGEALIRSGEAILAIVNAAGGLDEYLSVEQYADRIGVSRSTVQRQLQAHEIPNARKIGRQWTIRVSGGAA